MCEEDFRLSNHNHSATVLKKLLDCLCNIYTGEVAEQMTTAPFVSGVVCLMLRDLQHCPLVVLYVDVIRSVISSSLCDFRWYYLAGNV